MQSDIAKKAISAVNTSEMAYCKFLTPNDTGETGSHQSGIYIAKNSWNILFDVQGQRGTNMDRMVRIRWQEDFYTDSRFIYYGSRTRNEYRITRFGRGFPFLTSDNLGDLFIIIKKTDTDYDAYILSNETEINEFLEAFGMSPAETNRIIERCFTLSPEENVEQEFIDYIQSLTVDFPASIDMATRAREIYYRVFNHFENIRNNPDGELIKWIDMEYRLFRRLEYERYTDIINRGFKCVDDFIDTANIILNRRKSRAGKSLEHHLSAIFENNSLRFTAQAYTEGNKRPDFIFPGQAEYCDLNFSSEKLIFLGAKTTCKDRWRQILNEADRIEKKHLFTLQQGISPAQLNEMKTENVVLVVPDQYINTYPQEFRDGIYSLKKFIQYVREKSV